jgi:CHAT domain-containing protein
VRDVPERLESQLLRTEERFFEAEGTGDAALYDRVVEDWRVILDSLDTDSSDRFREDVFNRAGVAHWFRGSIRGDLADFGVALEYLDEALKFASGPYDQARYRHNIASIHHARYLWSGDPTELDVAVDASRAAVQAGARSPKLALFLLEAAQQLSVRYDLRGSLDDLEDGIRIARRAQRLTRDSVLQGTGLGILGAILRKRFVRTHFRRDIDESIRMLDADAKANADGNPDSVAVRLTNLGNALLDRHAFVGDEADLQRAIEAQERAVELSTPADRQFPHRLNNLGNSLVSAFEATDDREYLDAGLQAYLDALEYTPDGAPETASRAYNLGSALVSRMQVATVHGDVGRARDAYRMAAQGIHQSPEWALASARAWASWATSRHAWVEAAEAYDHGLRAMSQLFRTQLTRSSKETWLADTRGLPSRAAYAKAKAGDARAAVEAAEAARALLLSEALERDRADLERLLAGGHADLAERYQTGASRLEQLTGPAWRSVRSPGPGRDSRAASRTDRLRQAQAALDSAIADIRAVPGYETFLSSPTFADIVADAGDAPLVYVGAAEVGGLALVVRPDGRADPVWLPELTEEALAEHVAEYRTSYEAYATSARSPADRAPWYAAIDAVTGWLGTAVMSPILRRLRGSSTATFVPSGLLGVLPLHAAWVTSSRVGGRRYALDALAVAYTANARALGSARRLATTIGGEHLVAVDEPTLGRGPRFPRLPFSAVEVGVARSAFPDNAVFAGAAAIKADVVEAMDRADYLHLSCHGRADPSDPMESALAMAGGVPLTLRDIVDRPLHARLVILSACETAIPGEALPDEVVGFTSGFAEAGSAAALATLWSVPSLGTALLMTRFYEAWRVECLAPPEALRIAQIWLRDTTNGEKARHLEGLLPSSGHPLASAGTETLYRALVLDPDADPNATDHATPYHWAAFTYVGV